MGLDEIRRNIDLIDSEILRLLTVRMEQALRAARFKDRIEDRDRDEQVLHRARRLSGGLLSSDFVERLFLEIIKESKELQGRHETRPVFREQGGKKIGSGNPVKDPDTSTPGMPQGEGAGMRILLVGTGRMGTWLAGELCTRHKLAVYDREKRRTQALRGVRRLMEPVQAAAFSPELMINAVTINRVREAFETFIPHLPRTCILSDISSVKAGLGDYYNTLDRPFVSTHPMFGPTFGNLNDPGEECAIILKESHNKGKKFFEGFYRGLDLRVMECGFEEHDRMIATSLTIPFVSSLMFAAGLNGQTVPGTTFKRHLGIAEALLSEDDALLSEIILNPHSIKRIESISSRLAYLTHIVRARDSEEMGKFLGELRKNLKRGEGSAL